MKRTILQIAWFVWLASFLDYGAAGWTDYFRRLRWDWGNVRGGDRWEWSDLFWLLGI